MSYAIGADDNDAWPSGNFGELLAFPKDRSRVLISEPAHSWWQQFITEMQELVRLRTGWDGYRARPVSLSNAQFASQVVSSCCESDTPRPQLVPGVGGDLQLEWHTERFEIELHILRPNKVDATRICLATGQEEHAELGVDFSLVSKWMSELADTDRDFETAPAQ